MGLLTLCPPSLIRSEDIISLPRTGLWTVVLFVYFIRVNLERLDAFVLPLMLPCRIMQWPMEW